MAGQLTLDLRSLTPPASGVATVTAHVDTGRILVLLPENAPFPVWSDQVELWSRVGIGFMDDRTGNHNDQSVALGLQWGKNVGCRSSFVVGQPTTTTCPTVQVHVSVAQGAVELVSPQPSRPTLISPR